MVKNSVNGTRLLTRTLPPYIRWTNGHDYAKKASVPKQLRCVLDRGPFVSHMDYRSRLQFNAPSLKFPLSNIICTIGPASDKTETMVKLMAAGMRIVSLNFSYGSHEYHCRSILAARQAVQSYLQETGEFRPLAIALDTKGPEIRTGQIAGGAKAKIELKQGEKIKLRFDKDFEKNCSNTDLYIDYTNLPKVVKPKDMIFLDDGLIALRVDEVCESTILCVIQNGGKLGSHKGVNLPGIPVDLPSVSEKDKEDLKFGVDQNVDMIFASFIRNAKAVDEIRQVLGPEGKHIKIISKIENQQGMQNIDEIIAASDGIIVARGDLGIDIQASEVLLAQKSIIAKCNKLGKPVIGATRMLDSMVDKPRPMRAEASDVGNVIFDGADCVMLSAETAKGKYAVESVKCMANICAKVESVLWYDHIQQEMKSVITKDYLSAVTFGITEVASQANVDAIVIASPCSLMAKMISQNRPRCPIIMLTGNPRVARQLLIYRGIFPIVMEEMTQDGQDYYRLLSAGMKQLAKSNILDVDQSVTFMCVDALEAKNISFRLLQTQLESQAAKCKEIANIRMQCKKKVQRKFQKQADKPLTKEQIAKRERIAQIRAEKKLKRNCVSRDGDK